MMTTPQKPGLLNRREKIFLGAAVAGLTLTLIATAAMAGSAVPQPPNAGGPSAFEGDTRSFNPQPEPPPSPAMGAFDNRAISHPPDPGRVSNQGFVTR